MRIPSLQLPISHFFQLGELQEEIYMEETLGFTVNGASHQVKDYFIKTRETPKLFAILMFIGQVYYQI